MSFSYQFGANPPIDYPRLLIMDTQEFQLDASGNPTTKRAYIFEDSEIQAMTAMQTLQYQSSMQYSWPQYQTLPTSPVSYLRIAAMLLMCIASNTSKLSLFTRILDVQMAGNAANDPREMAQSYLAIDDDAGAFAIIEQCSTAWAFSDRYWKQVQRQSGQ